MAYFISEEINDNGFANFVSFIQLNRQKTIITYAIYFKHSREVIIVISIWRRNSNFARWIVRQEKQNLGKILNKLMAPCSTAFIVHDQNRVHTQVAGCTATLRRLNLIGKKFGDGIPLRLSAIVARPEDRRIEINMPVIV